MAEVLVSFDEPVIDDLGAYRARAIGHKADDGMWEGWIEFLAEDGPEVLATGVETTQPERGHLVYWATGLTAIYLEGALARARSPVPRTIVVGDMPATEAPAARHPTVRVNAGGPAALLDPFEVGGRSVDILRQELRAFNRPRLLNIIEAYDLNPVDADLTWMTNAQLVQFIVTAVETRLPRRAI